LVQGHCRGPGSSNPRGVVRSKGAEAGGSADADADADASASASAGASAEADAEAVPKARTQESADRHLTSPGLSGVRWSIGGCARAPPLARCHRTCERSRARIDLLDPHGSGSRLELARRLRVARSGARSDREPGARGWRARARVTGPGATQPAGAPRNDPKWMAGPLCGARSCLLLPIQNGERGGGRCPRHRGEGGARWRQGRGRRGRRRRCRGSSSSRRWSITCSPRAGVERGRERGGSALARGRRSSIACDRSTSVDIPCT